MANSPAHTGNPRSLGPAHGQRRNRSQMVRSRNHMNDSVDYSRERYEQHKSLAATDSTGKQFGFANMLAHVLESNSFLAASKLFAFSARVANHFAWPSEYYLWMMRLRFESCFRFSFAKKVSRFPPPHPRGKRGT